MRKALYCLLMVVLAVSLLVVGCGKAATPAPTPTTAPTWTPVGTWTPAPTWTPVPTPTLAFKPITLKFATHAAPGTPQSDAVVWWMDEIAKRTNNRVKAQIFWGGALAKEKETLDAVQAGTADMGMVTISYFEDKLPLNTMSNPMGFKPDYGILMEGAFKLFQEFPQFEEEFYRWNQKQLAPNGGSSYQFASKKLIRTLDDFKGLKVRSVGKYWPKWLQAVGAIPTTVTGPETYEALEKGILDASPIAYELMRSYRWYEVAKYVIEVDWGCVWGYGFTINLDVWKSLPPDIQQILSDTGKEFVQKHVSLTNAYIEETKKVIKDAGGQILPFPAADREKWKNMDVVKGTMDEWVQLAESKGFPGRAMMERYKQLIGY